MLFATYGAPSPPRGKNPVVIILGVCGGCVLLVVIGLVIVTAVGLNMTKGFTGGIVKMAQTMPAFLGGLKSHNYEVCESMVDPSVQSTLSAKKIKSMEEAVEKKLGPLQSFPERFESQSQNQIMGPGGSGRPMKTEFIYTYPLTYEKGKARATFKFVGDMSKLQMSGKVVEFKLEPDSQ